MRSIQFNFRNVEHFNENLEISEIYENLFPTLYTTYFNKEKKTVQNTDKANIQM